MSEPQVSQDHDELSDAALDRVVVLLIRAESAKPDVVGDTSGRATP